MSTPLSLVVLRIWGRKTPLRPCWFSLQAGAFSGHGLSLLAKNPCVRLRLLESLCSKFPRRKGTKKIIQVAPSLRGLRTRGTALTFVLSHRKPFAFSAGVAAFRSNQRNQQLWSLISIKVLSPTFLLS